MPQIINRIEIDAPVERVYRVARDPERFPEFMPDVKSIRVLERSADGARQVVEWTGRIPEFRVTVKWIEEDVWDDSTRTCRFSLVAGDFKNYGGSWQFTEVPGGTLFESIVSYEIEIALVGPLIQGVIRKKMAENVDRLQEAMKRRVENEGAA